MQKLSKSLEKSRKDIKACLQMPLVFVTISSDKRTGHYGFKDITLMRDIKEDLKRADGAGEKVEAAIGWTVIVPLVILCTGGMLLPISIAAATGRLAIGVLEGGYYAIQDLKKIIAGSPQMMHPPEPFISDDSQYHELETSSWQEMMASLDTPHHKRLQNFSIYTQQYIESFEAIEPYSIQINNLKLTCEEKRRFEKMLGTTLVNIPDIPVILNEKRYDLNTLLTCFDHNKMDPVHKVPFTLDNIMPDSQTNRKIQVLIETIKQERNAPQLIMVKEDQVNQSSTFLLQKLN